MATAQGFVFNVCGAWVFDIKFPKPIWLDVQDRFTKAQAEHLHLLEEEEEGKANEREDPIVITTAKDDTSHCD